MGIQNQPKWRPKNHNGPKLCLNCANLHPQVARGEAYAMGEADQNYGCTWASVTGRNSLAFQILTVGGNADYATRWTGDIWIYLRINNDGNEIAGGNGMGLHFARTPFLGAL